MLTLFWFPIPILCPPVGVWCFVFAFYCPFAAPAAAAVHNRGSIEVQICLNFRIFNLLHCIVIQTKKSEHSISGQLGEKESKEDKSCLINCKNQNLRWCLCLKTGTCILNAEKVIATEIGTGELEERVLLLLHQQKLV